MSEGANFVELLRISVGQCADSYRGKEITKPLVQVPISAGLLVMSIGGFFMDGTGLDTPGALLDRVQARRVTDSLADGRRCFPRFRGGDHPAFLARGSVTVPVLYEFAQGGGFSSSFLWRYFR